MRATIIKVDAEED